MVRCAPRIHPDLLEALERLDRRGVPIAETHRRLGALADRLDRPRPSYQRVRLLVHEHRARQDAPDPLIDWLASFASPNPMWEARKRGLV
jgi:hypothetical protein